MTEFINYKKKGVSFAIKSFLNESIDLCDNETALWYSNCYYQSQTFNLNVFDKGIE